MRREVEFEVEDGTVLSGYFHAPADGPGPLIVMAHGFSGVKEQIDHYAACFAAGGFAVLVYDHRGFGTSEGLPRLEVDPLRQLADWRDAITFAAAGPDVQPGVPVGVWGSSFAGGLAMVLAADDDRVGCVVAQIPNVSGHRTGPELFDSDQRDRLAALFGADRRARLDGAEPARIAVFATEPGEPCALPPTVSPRYISAVTALAPTWVNEVTLRSVEHMLTFEPAGWVPHVSPTPLLMIVGADDTVTPAHLQQEIFHAAPEPKRLVIHPGGHFDTYSEHFEQTSRAALDWFTTHLDPPTGT
ncbi:alpha/beta hydrolase [Mycobacterium sp. WMMD1722]|uniref:alpha/beta hydrolase n=1 Tax=Mycobacterium sp. WMMD1722 TaxID=3404117 RepID=UPI003BF5AF0F